MTLRIIAFFRELARSVRASASDESPFSIELTRELGDLRKILLNLLMAFLAVPAISASHPLVVTTLALLVYTINLHIAINTRFLQSNPALSRFFHVIPLLGIFCMAAFKLVVIVQSPVIAASILLVCALPPLIIAAHFAQRCAELILIPFPVPMQDVTPVAPGPTEQRVALSC